MKYEFVTYQMQVEEHVFWVAESRALKGCVGQGETVQEAILELEENELEWLDMAKTNGFDVPKEAPRSESHFSGRVSLRMSPHVHEIAKENADTQGISLNQYLCDAVVYYNALMGKDVAPSISHTFNISIVPELTSSKNRRTSPLLPRDTHPYTAGNYGAQFFAFPNSGFRRKV